MNGRESQFTEQSPDTTIKSLFGYRNNGNPAPNNEDVLN